MFPNLFDICFRLYNKSHINLEYVEANCCEITLMEQGHTKGTARQPMV